MRYMMLIHHDEAAGDKRMQSYQTYWASRGHLLVRAVERLMPPRRSTVAMRAYLQRQPTGLN